MLVIEIEPSPLQQILDYTNYYMNLTDANSKDDPKWQIEYKAKVTELFILNVAFL